MEPQDLDAFSFLSPAYGERAADKALDRLATTRWLEALKTVDPAEGGAWTITHTPTGKILGLFLYGNFEPQSGRVAISYGLQAEARKQGFAREAFASVIPYIFSLSPIVEIVADIEPANVSSSRLAVSVGFKRRPDEYAELPDGRAAERYVLSREM